jgi:hypothetical protein
MRTSTWSMTRQTHVFGGSLTINDTLTMVGGGQLVTGLIFHSPATLDGTGTVTYEHGGGQIVAQGTVCP